MEKEDPKKKKLTRLIKDFALLETTKKNRVPAAISDYFLGEYGLKRCSKMNNLSDEEGTNFIINLEDYLKKKCKTRRMVEDKFSQKFDLKETFMKSCDAYATAKNEYLQATLKMNSLLYEIVRVKEKFSEHLKEKSLMKLEEIQILDKKLHVMKLQSLLKIFSESNAWVAHLKLKEILAERLKSLQLQCSNLTELSEKYQELKNNKTYIELFQLYKQLLKREMKVDYMIKN